MWMSTIVQLFSGTYGKYALKFRSESLLICLDDKHRIKCGEPGFPVAAAERGWRVIVSLNEEFQVGDHDFTRFSIIHVSCFILIYQIPSKVLGTVARFVSPSKRGCFNHPHQ